VHVRVVGVVIKNDHILLLNQDTGSGRAWSLPGGRSRKVSPSAPRWSGSCVKLADLQSLGFTEKFGQLAMTGFPGAGSYMGAKSNIGL
jgi:hypothetical protein